MFAFKQIPYFITCHRYSFHYVKFILLTKSEITHLEFFQGSAQPATNKEEIFLRVHFLCAIVFALNIHAAKVNVLFTSHDLPHERSFQKKKSLCNRRISHFHSDANGFYFNSTGKIYLKTNTDGVFVSLRSFFQN